MEVIPFVPEHLRAFEQSQVALGAHWMHPELLAHCLANNPSFTLLDNEGLIVGAAGVILLWPGVGEAWLLTTPAAPRHAVYGFKLLRTLLHQIQENLNLFRVQSILYDSPTSLRVGEILGMAPEYPDAPLKHYHGPGKHGIMAVRFWGVS